MTKLVPSLVCFLAAFSTQVLGGSRAWESVLTHQALHTRHEAAIPIPVDAAGYAISSLGNDTRHDSELEKRWLGIVAGQSSMYLWPDSTISYCFDSTASRDKIFKYLDRAIQSWITAGLSREVYKYKEVVKPGTACTGHAQRDAILVISHNELGLLQTTVGIWSLDPQKPDYVGPTMELSTRDDIHHLNVVANFAHEMGHAWGLYHEHQNPKFWGPPYGGQYDAALAGTVFGTNFDCSALRDYHVARERIATKNAGDPAKIALHQAQMCTNINVANTYRFSATDWLPIVSNYKCSKSVPYTRAGYEHVDWDSIMLYPSGAGGIGSARPPTGPDENPDAYDQRTPVLRRNDGAKIVSNTVPSAGDVAGIRELYDSSAVYYQTHGKGLQLINDKKHKRFTDFMKDFSLKKKKSCNLN